MKFNREFYIPKGATKVASKNSSAVAHIFDRAGAPYGVGFFGKADKPAFNFRFRSTEHRARFLTEWFSRMDSAETARADRKAQHKAKLSQPHALQVGDILSGSWGYDQTNIEWYEVTALVGKRMVELREVCVESEETAYMQGKCVPIPGKYTSKPAIRRMVNESGSVKLFDWGGYLSKEEPTIVHGAKVYRSRHWTAYA